MRVKPAAYHRLLYTSAAVDVRRDTHSPMGTGEKFDPNSTVGAPAGRYVIHYGGKVHYDGAKNEETIIQVWGMGPATSTPAEKR